MKYWPSYLISVFLIRWNKSPIFKIEQCVANMSRHPSTVPGWVCNNALGTPADIYIWDTFEYVVRTPLYILLGWDWDCPLSASTSAPWWSIIMIFSGYAFYMTIDPCMYMCTYNVNSLKELIFRFQSQSQSQSCKCTCLAQTLSN